VRRPHARRVTGGVSSMSYDTACPPTRMRVHSRADTCPHRLTSDRHVSGKSVA